MTSTYEVVHRTTYRYGSDVSSSYGQLHLLPRDLPGQRCRRASVAIEPAPLDQRERRDYFGNRTTYFAVVEPHARLELVSTSVVEVQGRQGVLPLLADQPWDEVRDRLRGGPRREGGAAGLPPDEAVLDARQFVLDSPRIAASPRLAAYAAASFVPGRPLLDEVADLSSRINRDFRYDPSATDVGSSLEQVLDGRAGVCQDFAHLTIGCLRSLGLAARYVSGYLETRPPPGRPRLQGADVSHAWASVFSPEGGWVDVDPTNDQFVGERYVTTAWGRDYGDVTPVEGVIFTEGATTQLEVAVDVVRLDGNPVSAPPGAG